jgi:hypothetical protein
MSKNESKKVEITKDSTTKSFDNFLSSQVAEGETSSLIRRSHLYSIGSIFRYARSRFDLDKVVPVIRISGFWLEKYGFKIGRRFEIYLEKNQLTLRLVNIVEPPEAPELLPSSGLPTGHRSRGCHDAERLNVRLPNG